MRGRVAGVEEGGVRVAGRIGSARRDDVHHRDRALATAKPILRPDHRVPEAERRRGELERHERLAVSGGHTVIAWPVGERVDDDTEVTHAGQIVLHDDVLVGPTGQLACANVLARGRPGDLRVVDLVVKQQECAVQRRDVGVLVVAGVGDDRDAGHRIARDVAPSRRRLEDRHFQIVGVQHLRRGLRTADQRRPVPEHAVEIELRASPVVQIRHHLVGIAWRHRFTPADRGHRRLAICARGEVVIDELAEVGEDRRQRRRVVRQPGLIGRHRVAELFEGGDRLAGPRQQARRRVRGVVEQVAEGCGEQEFVLGRDFAGMAELGEHQGPRDRRRGVEIRRYGAQNPRS